MARTTKTNPSHVEIKEMNRATANQIGAEVRDAMEKIAIKYGMSFSRGNGVFTETEFRIANIKFSVTSDIQGTRNKQEVDDFMFYAPLNGIKKTALGTPFDYHGAMFTIIGWNRKARKNKVLLRKDGDTNGGIYVASVRSIKFSLPKELVDCA